MRPLFVAVVALVLAVQLQAAVPANQEYILISGGPSLFEWEKFKMVPHDKWWGNFIRTARVRIEDLRKERGPDYPITWLVYQEAYINRGKQENRDLVALIESVRDKYGVKLVWFNKGPEVLDYLNYGQKRSDVKIAGLEFYGHSNKACWLFDYSNEIDSASKAYLHESQFKDLKRGIFARDAFIKSWGCHTGESMSQKFRQATGMKMYGAVGRTDYSGGSYAELALPTDRWAY